MSSGNFKSEKYLSSFRKFGGIYLYPIQTYRFLSGVIPAMLEVCRRRRWSAQAITGVPLKYNHEQQRGAALTLKR